ncbi:MULTISPECIES: NAD(P)H-quinone oxidoreductase [unclassified Legionella]|uniref:NAD(P)H-quinone oxidoreductase n=1 Tax=unclassified Legionella TaxID=2622702 RepID=UPI0010563991|nr:MULTISPECIES: NAD(P)H-quinone oxidoreductase [unclassified Legionella]MDI9819286.1 NAD(P)H-quinone oxidoreductase [Legionella sp. PL877]
MRCVLIENPGPLSRLVISEQEEPACKSEELLVQVRATALNRADLFQRQGFYPPPAGASVIPGLEIAGEVITTGTEVTRFAVGDLVYGLVPGGGYAEYCCINQNLAQHIPEHWSFLYAAALPEALMTAHASIFLLGQLRQGQTLLIHAAGSGISSLAIQMAKMQGANIISTAGSEEKIAKASNLGAMTLINYEKEDIETVLDEKSIDLIVDFIGGSYFLKHLYLLKTQGKLIQIGAMQGIMSDCNLALVMQKRLQIHGFVLRSQPLFEKAALWESSQQEWASALLNKSIVPIIDSEFTLDSIEQAHARMQDRTHFGKIVVRVG